MSTQSILQNKKIMILGPTGQVGRRLLYILNERGVPSENIILVSKEKKKISYANKSTESHLLNEIESLAPDVVFNTMPADAIKNYIGYIWNNKVIIIDKSSAFRMGSEVPLIVPEINGNLIKDNNLIASPNSIAVPLSMVLQVILPILVNLQSISVSTYQSVSGAGNDAMNALLDELKESFFDPKVNPKYFEKQIAFNLIPKIGEFDTNFTTEEENMIELETNKILDKKLPLSVICVRVPTLTSHCIALHIACDNKNIHEIQSLLNVSEGIKFLGEGGYLSPIEATHEDYVYVGRLKKTTCGISMWITCDNLGKGSALNMIQIAELRLV
jgi:aspartate-semialdehyde dehydrogenase